MNLSDGIQRDFSGFHICGEERNSILSIFLLSAVGLVFCNFACFLFWITLNICLCRCWKLSQIMTSSKLGFFFLFFFFYSTAYLAKIRTIGDFWIICKFRRTVHHFCLNSHFKYHSFNPKDSTKTSNTLQIPTSKILHAHSMQTHKLYSMSDSIFNLIWLKPIILTE